MPKARIRATNQQNKIGPFYTRDANVSVENPSFPILVFSQLLVQGVVSRNNPARPS
jgi:hypothetical protein